MSRRAMCLCRVGQRRRTIGYHPCVRLPSVAHRPSRRHRLWNRRMTGLFRHVFRRIAFAAAAGLVVGPLAAVGRRRSLRFRPRIYYPPRFWFPSAQGPGWIESDACFSPPGCWFSRDSPPAATPGCFSDLPFGLPFSPGLGWLCSLPLFFSVFFSVIWPGPCHHFVACPLSPVSSEFWRFSPFDWPASDCSRLETYSLPAGSGRPFGRLLFSVRGFSGHPGSADQASGHPAFARCRLLLVAGLTLTTEVFWLSEGSFCPPPVLPLRGNCFCPDGGWFCWPSWFC